MTAKLAFVDGDQGTVVFHRDGADLILRKIINPDGEVNELTAPHFAKKKALAIKGPLAFTPASLMARECRLNCSQTATPQFGRRKTRMKGRFSLALGR